MTPKQIRSSAERSSRLDELLDAALQDTFPASDPVAIAIEEVDTRPGKAETPPKGQ